jgi:serine/threonine-protein kinase
MNRPDALLDTVVAGRYRIVRVVGMGGMARVYAADDETLGRRIALKVLDGRYAADAQFVERFLREASNAARLNHPNIVQVYDRGETDDGTWFIAMEYVEGRTLKDLVVQRGRLTEPEVFAYTRQALQALRFAHRNGVVHRDIKPHNLMVDNDGRVKVADFGIARAGSDQGLTEVGSIVGTAQYLSPEQARGEHVAASSDLYSLGVVMFELATGRVPFEGDSPVNVALKHVNDPVPAPRSINPDISPALEAVILRALRKDPEERYTTADEMLADLDAARRGQVSADTAAITRVLPAAAAVDATTIQAAPLTPPPAGVTGWAADAYRDTDFADDELAAATGGRNTRGARTRRRWVIAAIVLLALLAAGLWYAYANSTDNNDAKKTAVVATVDVPDVTGDTLDRATQHLTEAHLKVGAVTKQASTTVDEGRVISSDPDAGSRATRGSKVDLVVSSGPDMVDVPTLTGKTLDDATAAAKAAGFTVKATEVENADEDPGTVLEQSPAGGEQAPSGSAIALQVAKAPKEVTVPDVSGRRSSDARATLEGLGLTVSIDKSQDGSTPENEVFGQDPAAGSKVKPGSTVTLQVGSGYNSVPSVLGQGSDEATQTLRDAGYNVQVNTASSDDPNLPSSGQVTDQQPTADSRLKLGYTVTITVTTGSGVANRKGGKGKARHERRGR